jgi:hypothetical protein
MIAHLVIFGSVIVGSVLTDTGPNDAGKVDIACSNVVSIEAGRLRWLVELRTLSIILH